jgi:hypothetical protein
LKAIKLLVSKTTFHRGFHRGFRCWKTYKRVWGSDSDELSESDSDELSDELSEEIHEVFDRLDYYADGVYLVDLSSRKIERVFPENLKDIIKKHKLKPPSEPIETFSVTFKRGR